MEQETGESIFEDVQPEDLMFTVEDTRAFACACVRKRAVKAFQSDILFPKQQSQKVGLFSVT